MCRENSVLSTSIAKGVETSLHVQRKQSNSLADLVGRRNISACAEKTHNSHDFLAGQ